MPIYLPRRAASSLSLPLAYVKRRLRDDANPLVANHRRLVSIPPDTYAALEVAAKKISRGVGFFVWPAQVAALLIESGIGQAR